MNPGELNCRIILLKETNEPDEQGGFETTYTVRATVWAKLMTVTTKTIDQYEQLSPELLHRIVIRYRSDVAVTDRIQYGGRTFEQLGPSINGEKKKAYLKLECREMVADAAND